MTKWVCGAMLGAVLVGAPLLAQDITVDFNPAFRFDQMTGYSWGKLEASDPLLEPRMAAAIDHVLQGYGFKESAKTGETGKPGNIIVAAVEDGSQQGYSDFYDGMKELDWHREWSSGGFAETAASLQQIHPGTLIVDLYDGATGKLVWRGVAAEGIAPKERTNADNVDKAVNTMLAKFPPASGRRLPPNQMEVRTGPSAIALTSPN